MQVDALVNSADQENATGEHSSVQRRIEGPQRVQGSTSRGGNPGSSFDALLGTTDRNMLNRYYGRRKRKSGDWRKDQGVYKFLLRVTNDSLSSDGPVHILRKRTTSHSSSAREGAKQLLREFMDTELKVQRSFRAHRSKFPTQIWNCCKNLCFASASVDRRLESAFDKLLVIHEYSELMHKAAEKMGCYVDQREKGIGTSTVAFRSEGRRQKSSASDSALGHSQRKHMESFDQWVASVLPFLYGKSSLPDGGAKLPRKLCTLAICCLLGVSKNYLYNRTNKQRLGSASDDELRSMVDITGLRLRQRRRNGDRGGYPPLHKLQEYECGCDPSCLSDIPAISLVSEYNDFSSLAKQLKPRHKENQFLIDRLFCPLSKSALNVCNRALSALYTVSEELIADVRRLVVAMCSDPSIISKPVVTDGAARYKYARGHPMNRFPDTVRNRIEDTLNMVLRADPAGENGDAYCRLYSPEINTQEKLHKVLRDSLRLDEESAADLSSSSLQRMVNVYLKERNYKRICFTQSDHNACPNCKALMYAILQYHHEAKLLNLELEKLNASPRPLSFEDAMGFPSRFEELRIRTNNKRFQEEECVQEMQSHNGRDGRIRKRIKQLTDHFRNVENSYRSVRSLKHLPATWNSLRNHASITHQDDMSKVDLPHFIVSASADITRWRFDVNAHVNSVTNDAVIFSHEQGMGAKTASSIIEEILLHHLLFCRGESIKVVVSDNAAVGKNWMSTIAFPQYIVDQGLADIAVMIFLENNHSKWLADMLFGQFQTKKRRTTVLGIDDMLSCFQEVRRKDGKVYGFALNPLSSVDFVKVFESLGYQTTPIPEFGFTKRNIHFSAACAPGAKQRISDDLRVLLGSGLPDDAGMVRVSTEPPTTTPQDELPYEQRFFDVPAMRIVERSRRVQVAEQNPEMSTAFPAVIRQADDKRPAACENFVCGTVNRTNTVLPMGHSHHEQHLLFNHTSGTTRATAQTHNKNPLEAPLIVPLGQNHTKSGEGVVSNRTALHVGYNGIEFRKLAACPELKQDSTPLVRRAWPPGLIRQTVSQDLPCGETESRKCAPLNWIVRRPVSHFCNSESDWKARYPPRNLLNAKFKKGPRDEDPWVPTATYSEPPFPFVNGTAAALSIRKFSDQNMDIRQSLHVLDLLRAIYEDMGGRETCRDQWLQKNCTPPDTAALLRYREALKLYVKREKGHPKAPRTLRQIFNADPAALEEVEAMVPASLVLAQKERNKRRKEALQKLFEKTENMPGALDKYVQLVEKDHERYASELRLFKEKQKEFDEMNGISPRSALRARDGQTSAT